MCIRFGSILGKHQKLVPTVGERLVHAPGCDAAPRAFDAEFGPISGLLWGENSNPLAVFAYIAQNTRIHVASWPHLFFPGWNTMKEATLLVGQGQAYQAKAFVIDACGTIYEEMLRVLPATAEDRAILEDPETCGGPTIISPFGRIIVGPMGPEEGILYADIDLEDTVRGKFVHDFAGHYNRADIFQLNVNMGETPIYNPVRAPVRAPMGGSIHQEPPSAPEAAMWRAPLHNGAVDLPVASESDG